MPIGKDFLNQLQNVQVSQRQTAKTVKDLIVGHQNEKIIFASYQRTFVWDTEKQCRFIESIFMNVPIPAIFLLEKIDKDGKTHEVIDGVQRVTTLIAFKEGILRLRGLTKLPDLNQATFGTLPPEVREFFYEQELQLIIIERTTNPDIQFEIFERLNQGSVSLNAQELRNCMFHGSFNDFLIQLSKKEAYRELLTSFPKFKPVSYGRPDKNRMLSVEIILQFFALYENHRKLETGDYPAPKKELLNSYMMNRANYQVDDSMNDDSSQFYDMNNDELEALFDKVILMTKMTFAGNQFKRFDAEKDTAQFTKTFSKSVFDVQCLGFSDYKVSDIEDKTEIIYDAFLDVSSYDRDFILSITRSTAQKINDRMTIWKNKLTDVIENPTSYFEKLELKKKRFSFNLKCYYCNQTIDEIDEADFKDNQLYHRICHLENTKRRKKPMTIDIPIEFGVNGSTYDCEDIVEALQLFMVIVVEGIMDDEYGIERLASLNFIGTVTELSERSTERNKRFKPLDITNAQSKRLFIDVSGSRSKNLAKMKEIASMYSFLSDFELYNET